MKTRVLVLGRTGMLGHMVLRTLDAMQGMVVRGTHRDDKADPLYFDAMGPIARLEEICRKDGGYNYCINCIGITADTVRGDDPASVSTAERINAVFPHELADIAVRYAMRVIHISTDGVFAGLSQYYDENAPCDCTDIYGKTKKSGEVISSNVLTIRCSIIGPSPSEKRGLFEWFRSQPDGSEVPGYTNHLWNGVTTYQFAELCGRIISGGYFDVLRHESPLFHFAPNQPVSKYDLLLLLKKVFVKNVAIIPVENKAGPVRRILVSRYEGLKHIYGGALPMEKAILQLQRVMNTQKG